MGCVPVSECLSVTRKFQNAISKVFSSILFMYLLVSYISIVSFISFVSFVSFVSYMSLMSPICLLYLLCLLFLLCILGLLCLFMSLYVSYVSSCFLMSLHVSPSPFMSLC